MMTGAEALGQSAGEDAAEGASDAEEEVVDRPAAAADVAERCWGFGFARADRESKRSITTPVVH